MGFVFGLFLGAMGDMQPLRMINGREVPQAPLREQVRWKLCASPPWRRKNANRAAESLVPSSLLDYRVLLCATR